jgi:hypothetical protein
VLRGTCARLIFQVLRKLCKIAHEGINLPRSHGANTHVKPTPSHGMQLVMSSGAPHQMASVMVTRRWPNVLVGCAQRHSIGHGRNGRAPQALSMQRPFQLLRFFVFSATVPLQILFILDEQCIESASVSRRMSPLRPVAVYSIIEFDVTDMVWAY